MSLLELVLAIVIMGILATVAILAGFNATQAGFSVNAEADRVASNIRYVQLQAMTEDEPLRFNIDSSTSYSLTDLSGNAENRPALKGNSVSLTDISLSTDLPNDCVAFDSKGDAYTSCTDTSTAFTSERSITLTEGGQSVTLLIKPHSGTVVES